MTTSSSNRAVASCRVGTAAAAPPLAWPSSAERTGKPTTRNSWLPIPELASAPGALAADSGADGTARQWLFRRRMSC